ncbi:MAG: Gfo/Idh/MocA family oxidoreductase [Firmicutes bacterium]|nr:Gfo/Idh/MocA family oxidoreductase [Bacillota bacterium]
MSGNLGVAVVGYGMGSHHCNLIGKTPGLELLAVCEMDAERLKRAQSEHPGVTGYQDFAEVLKCPSIGLVVIATPRHTHKDLVIQAMDAGKNVVVEKVMCVSTSQADEMIAARDRNGVMLSVFHNRRWDTDFLSLKAVLEAGLLGEVFLVESSVFTDYVPRGWRREATLGGGLIYDWGAHMIDQALQLNGTDPSSLWCNIITRRDTDTEAHFRCSMKFASGQTYEVEVCSISKIRKPRWHVFGDKGTLTREWFEADEKMKLRTRLGDMEGEVLLDPVKGDWAQFYGNISDVLHGKAELAVKPEEARRGIRVIEAALRSNKTRQEVVL